ncbi:hypothetical protein [Serratia ureilytica]|uniref:hypothetical protein n=1 Tax=Serratia ureilytica TaxID=300181 RepID=UPI001F5C3843|nr:hypothetical protein [Serratia ureilytica]
MVQRYNPDYVMHAARFAPFARENEHGEFVKFSDYEILKAERDALAVENAAQKSAHPQPFGREMMKALDAYEKHQDEVPETGMLDAFFILRDSIRVETAATDAALAAIQAQGVDKIIKLKMEQLASMHPDTHSFGATAESLRAQINELQAFAANIREAK